MFSINFLLSAGKFSGSSLAFEEQARQQLESEGKPVTDRDIGERSRVLHGMDVLFSACHDNKAISAGFLHA